MAALQRNRGSIVGALLFHLLLVSRHTDTNAFESIYISPGLIGSGQKRGRPSAVSRTRRGGAVELLWLPNSFCRRRYHGDNGLFFFSRDPSCQYHQSRQEDFDSLQVTSSIYDSSSSGSTETVRLGADADAEDSASSLDSSSSRLTVGQTKPIKRKSRTSSSRLKWDTMILRLEQFRKTHGHSLVTHDCDDQDLYRWAVTIRQNYRHQVLGTNSMIERHRLHHRRNHHCQLQEPSDTSSNQLPQQQRRHRLSTEKLLQLSALDFCWDVYAALWDRRYEELRAFSKHYGHVNVPPSHPGGLGFWVQNQRREYRRLAKLGLSSESSSSSSSSSTLILDNRLERLESLNFEWKLEWDNMILRLERFRKVHGHSIITRDCDDQDLYRWADTIRRNYRHQVLGTSSMKQRRLRHRQLQPFNTSSTIQFSSEKSKVITTASRQKQVQQQQQQHRPRLSTEKLLQLSALDFCWDVQAALWNRRYEELRAFSKQHGHVSVPLSHPGGLGFWVHKQRREYRRLVKLGPESSTLILDNRLERLESLNFEWCQAHEDLWLFQYEALKKFYKQHGHSNVPEDFKANFSLGQWCMNQRTAYKRYCAAAAAAGHNHHNNATVAVTSTSTVMSLDRIKKLERLDFCWAYREQKWDDMKQRLVDYNSQHGNIRIPTNDAENQDLRIWLSMQRYYYNRRRGGQRHYRASVVARDAIDDNDNDVNDRSSETSSIEEEGLLSPLTEHRIQELENAIPGFRWTVYETGPSRKDWAKLFNAMREKGIQPGMRPKQHWFEGTNPFSIAVKDRWTEEDLLELWNQDDGNDDDDDDMSWRVV